MILFTTCFSAFLQLLFSQCLGASTFSNAQGDCSSLAAINVSRSVISNFAQSSLVEAEANRSGETIVWSPRIQRYVRLEIPSEFYVDFSSLSCFWMIRWKSDNTVFFQKIIGAPIPWYCATAMINSSSSASREMNNKDAMQFLLAHQ